MDKTKLILDIAQQLLKVIKDMRTLADSVEVVCTMITDGLSEQPAQPAPAMIEQKAEPEIHLEKVRGVLADKSRAGFTAEVREIIQRHGASRLSEIDSKEYPAVLKEAEELKNE